MYHQYVLLVPVDLFHVSFHNLGNADICTLVCLSLLVVCLQDQYVYRQHCLNLKNPLSFLWGVHGGCHAPHY